MKPMGLQIQQKQPIAFGRSKVVRTKSREVLKFLSEDVSNTFSESYKTKFLKKYKFNIQEQSDNNELLGIMVSGFKKKVLSGFNYAYRHLPDAEFASKILKAKDRYGTNLYQKSKNEIIEIKTLKDLTKHFPV